MVSVAQHTSTSYWHRLRSILGCPNNSYVPDIWLWFRLAGYLADILLPGSGSSQNDEWHQILQPGGRHFTYLRAS